MNLVGKIFIFLVFVMSVVFSAFSVMVYATHKNWKDEVLRTEATADGKPVGWKKRLENEQRLKDEALAKLSDLTDEKAAIQVANRQAIAKLEQEKDRLSNSSTLLTTQYKKKSDLLAQALADVDVAEKKLEVLRTEGNKMKEENRVARDVITAKYDLLLKVREQLNQNVGKVASLDERNKQLNGELGAYIKVLQDSGIKNVEAVASLPPLSEGLVMRVKKYKDDTYVELTLGSDDGLQKGHQLEVYRGSKYLGRIDIVQAHPDRSVGKVDRRSQQGLIQERDHVRAQRSLKLTAG